MSKLINGLIASAFLLVVTNAHANFVTLSFPSSSSTVVASDGTYFFQDNHYVSEQFSSTGLTEVNSLALHLGVSLNILRDAGFVNFDVLLNGNDVGDIAFTDNTGTGFFDFLFNFDPIAGVGVGNDDYTIMLDETNTVPFGDGSISFDRVSSNATLTAASVPEPGTLALVGLSLAGFAFSRRKGQSRS